MQAVLLNNKNNIFSYGMAFFCTLLTISILSGCSSRLVAVRTFSDGDNKGSKNFPIAFIKDKSIYTIGARVGKQFNLEIEKNFCLEGAGAGVAVNPDGSTQYFYFDYTTYEHALNQAQARVLIVNLIKELKKQIHSKENFSGYFYYYPLEKGQLVVSVSFKKLITKGLLFFDDKWSLMEDPFIGTVLLNRSQNICYHIYNTIASSKDVEIEESLENAQEIVHGKEEFSPGGSQEQGPILFMESVCCREKKKQEL